jgi:hypothetical protein
MGGRASLLLVIGFGLIFMTMSSNFNSLTLKSIDGYGAYLNEAMAYYIAVSGANMAANEIFIDRTWGKGFSGLSFNGGTLNVYVSNTTAGTAGKVEICHIPPGNPGSRHTLWVPSSALSAHLAHGDYLGQCDSAVSSQVQTATIISEGTYAGITKAVIVELRPASYAKYGNFYANMSAYPATGDTFNGPFHVNAKLYTSGSPVFWGKVTTKSGLVMQGTKDPKFYGGYSTGIDIPNDFDTSGLRANAASAGKVFRDTTGANKTVDVKLYFNADGTVTYSKRTGTGSYSTAKTVAITTLAPNGLIYVEKGNIYTKGTVNGSVTMVASKKGSSGYGQVIFEDNLIYNKNPKTYTNSTDMMGIVAESNIRIQDNTTTKGKDIYTQASMYSVTGNIGPEDGLVNQSALKSWRILGGLIAADTRVTANYNSAGNPTNGLRFVHAYDDRFATAVPPYFPKTKYYEIVSWYE